MINNSLRFPTLLNARFLEGLPPHKTAELVGNCELRVYEKPRIIVDQHSAVNEFFIIARGTAEVSFVSAEGYRSVIVLTGVGDTLCAIEALSDAPAVCTVKVFANTVVLVVTAELLLAEFETEVLLRNLARLAMTSMKQDNQIRTIDKFYNAEQRICSYLSRLTMRNPIIRQDQSYLADIIGCSRQTLNKELGRLKDAKIIALSKGQIEVLDRPNLTRRIASLDSIR